jgi:ribosomal protein L15E
MEDRALRRQGVASGWSKLCSNRGQREFQGDTESGEKSWGLRKGGQTSSLSASTKVIHYLL